MNFHTFCAFFSYFFHSIHDIMRCLDLNPFPNGFNVYIVLNKFCFWQKHVWRWFEICQLPIVYMKFRGYLCLKYWHFHSRSPVLSAVNKEFHTNLITLFMWVHCILHGAKLTELQYGKKQWNPFATSYKGINWNIFFLLSSLLSFCVLIYLVSFRCANWVDISSVELNLVMPKKVAIYSNKRNKLFANL